MRATAAEKHTSKQPPQIAVLVCFVDLGLRGSNCYCLRAASTFLCSCVAVAHTRTHRQTTHTHTRASVGSIGRERESLNLNAAAAAAVAEEEFFRLSVRRQSAEAARVCVCCSIVVVWLCVRVCACVLSARAQFTDSIRPLPAGTNSAFLNIGASPSRYAPDRRRIQRRSRATKMRQTNNRQ